MKIPKYVYDDLKRKAEHKARTQSILTMKPFKEKIDEMKDQPISQYLTSNAARNISCRN